ncbi:hypothetical protein AB0M28_32635 [Streptomyces sp. NPDC051940]|uniref:hypothetical protein n=1 Tax=Streptomyces sp. NPDC051940 TaxID=3155675 RepID=UPI0034396BD3
MAITTHGEPSSRPAEPRLRWWALALPVAMFVTLLLALGSSDAEAASSMPLGNVLAWLADAFLHFF